MYFTFLEVTPAYIVLCVLCVELRAEANGDLQIYKQVTLREQEVHNLIPPSPISSSSPFVPHSINQVRTILTRPFLSMYTWCFSTIASDWGTVKPGGGVDS